MSPVRRFRFTVLNARQPFNTIPPLKGKLHVISPTTGMVIAILILIGGGAGLAAIAVWLGGRRD